VALAFISGQYNYPRNYLQGGNYQLSKSQIQLWGDRVRRNVSVSTFVDRSIRQDLLGEESRICKIYTLVRRSHGLYGLLKAVYTQRLIVCELNRVT